jgi:Zn-dependent protease with chaperone function
MKIIEIITEAEIAPVTAAVPTKKFQSLDTLNKDPAALVNTWAPRLSQLQARCNTMLANLIKAAGPQWAKKLAGSKITVRSTDQYVQANARDRTIIIDITVFWDAPDATLAVAIGHELGHIALAHVGAPATPTISRKDELDADDFAIQLARQLGYDTAEVFKFMHSKEEYDYINAITDLPNSTHPTYDQRIDRAKKQGFKLSKGGQQQIDALQQHLA